MVYPLTGLPSHLVSYLTHIAAKTVKQAWHGHGSGAMFCRFQIMRAEHTVSKAAPVVTSDIGEPLFEGLHKM